MISEGTVFKVLLAPAALFVGGDILPRIVHSGAEGVALAAAALAGIGYFWKVCRRGVGKFKSTSRRVDEGLDLIKALPEWQEKVDGHLERIDRRFEVLADADQHRIKDAVAGDQRSPVNRRA